MARGAAEGERDRGGAGGRGRGGKEGSVLRLFSSRENELCSLRTANRISVCRSDSPVGMDTLGGRINRQYTTTGLTFFTK
jgi:hypothetical protein